MSDRTIPAISIIIPMYNAEKYIKECLESVFAQTFIDYELLLVDHCSTDGSLKIAEEYVPKFEGRLRIVKLKVNSGSPATPRNTGIRLSRGKYLMFIDSDDVVTNTALEELYPLAEKFKAEVVHCRAFYSSTEDNIVVDKKLLKVSPNGQKFFVKKPELVPVNLEQRVASYVQDRFWTAPWNYLFLRDFIVENDITFPNVKVTQDALFIFFVVCLSKVFVTVPNIFYVYRKQPDSIVRKASTPEEGISKRGSSVFKGITVLDKFMNNFELFKKKPEYKYRVFDYWGNNNFNHLVNFYAQISPYKLDEFVRNELAEIDDTTALTAYLFSRMNVFHINMIKNKTLLQQQVQKLQPVKSNK